MLINCLIYCISVSADVTSSAAAPSANAPTTEARAAFSVPLMAVVGIASSIVSNLPASCQSFRTRPAVSAVTCPAISSSHTLSASAIMKVEPTSTASRPVAETEYPVLPTFQSPLPLSAAATIPPASSQLAANLAAVKAPALMPVAVSQLAGIEGKFVKSVTVAIVPAVIFVGVARSSIPVAPPALVASPLAASTTALGKEVRPNRTASYGL